ncbi:MAG: hypothetical protein R8J85_02000 [Mariprofundales bacterium]
MLSQKLIDKTIKYFKTYSNEGFVVKPSLPILYFGDLISYRNSKLKVVTVGKNPSFNEFRFKGDIDFSFCRFEKWNPDKMNLIESLNQYFASKPLQWFSCFEPILNGMKSSYYKNDKFQNRVLHTDICSPIATDPTWSKLPKNAQSMLFEKGHVIWKELIEELQPDIMFVSIPFNLFNTIIAAEKGKLLISFKLKEDGEKRKKPYDVRVYNHQLKNGKNIKIVFGQAANTPFGTISKTQKVNIGELLLC